MSFTYIRPGVLLQQIYVNYAMHIQYTRSVTGHQKGWRFMVGRDDLQTTQTTGESRLLARWASSLLMDGHLLEKVIYFFMLCYLMNFSFEQALSRILDGHFSNPGWENCNKIYRSNDTTNICITVEDDAQSPTCREVTNCDRSLQSVINRHQFSDLVRIRYIGPPSMIHSVHPGEQHHGNLALLHRVAVCLQAVHFVHLVWQSFQV